MLKQLTRKLFILSTSVTCVTLADSLPPTKLSANKLSPGLLRLSNTLVFPAKSISEPQFVALTWDAGPRFVWQRHLSSTTKLLIFTIN